MSRSINIVLGGGGGGEESYKSCPGGCYKSCPGGGGGGGRDQRSDINLVLGGSYNPCPGGVGVVYIMSRGGAINFVLGGGGGGCVCEWYKSCPGGTTNHILGSVHTAVLGDVI